MNDSLDVVLWTVQAVLLSETPTMGAMYIL